jgi:2-hydroxychromene-2-carboxylate isomerase
MESAPENTLEFWYDLASPYSYLAAARVERVAGAAGLRVVWRPFLLGPIFEKLFGAQDSPFNLFPTKGRYLWRDLERLAQADGLAFRRPSRMPRSSVLAARVALAGASEGWVGRFSLAIFEENFARDRDIADEAVITDALSGLGVDAAAALSRAKSPEARPALREATALAERRGVFGAPTFFRGDEMFWGNDRLEQAVAWRP